MYYVYILELNDKNKSKKFYIGYSSDLKRRLFEHKSGNVFSTKDKKPELIYYEAYASIELARERERNLKKFGSAYVGLLKRIDKK